MGRKRRAEITIETDEVLVIRSRCAFASAWCGGCGATVRMATPEEAAALARVSPRTIYRWVEAGRIHFVEKLDGWLLICLNSLFGD